MRDKRKKEGNVPNLRFPEFEGEWEEKRLGEVAEISSGGTPSRANLSYWNGDIPWVSTSLIDFNVIHHTDEKITSEGLDNSSAKLFSKGSLLMAMYGQGKTRGKVAILGIEATTNQACASIVADKNILNTLFLYQDLTKRYDEIRDLSNQGGQENLSGTIIKQIIVQFPSLSEQNKIANFLSIIDERIETQNKIIKELKLLKHFLRNLIFKQIFKDQYEPQLLKEALTYEQPTNYLVKDTSYSDNSSLIPVLTANKSFILGYTDEDFGVYEKGECIIFDDFTMDLKYVDFPFKIKSSAIKILCAKKGVSLKFVFEYLSFLALKGKEHKRHYISETERIYIPMLNYEKQMEIADLLVSLDKKTANELNLLRLYGKQKQYFLATIFI